MDKITWKLEAEATINKLCEVASMTEKLTEVYDLPLDEVGFEPTLKLSNKQKEIIRQLQSDLRVIEMMM